MGISSSQNIEEQFKQDTETEESQDIISPKECIQNLQLLEKYIFSLNENNIQETSESTMKLFNKSFPYSWHLVICRLIFASFISQRKSINIFLDYLKLIDKKEEEIFDQSFDRILNVLTQFILTLNSRESDYVLMKMYEQNIVNQSILKRKRSIYFAQFLSDETFKMIQYNEINWNFKNVIKNVKENDWELHKKLIKEGHNPNEIAKIIRNDEIEKLQEISSQNNFDFDQIIEPSLYERYSFINEENVSLIDYAAFFGAIQCFKYLLMNNANVENTGKYAIAGGNLEIIHLCQQSCAKFKDTYETAIQFHQNDAFNYLYENKIEEINNLNYLGIRCIKYDNYEIFSFLENEGMEVDTIIINETIRTGNIFFANYFLEGKSYPKNSFF